MANLHPGITHQVTLKAIPIVLFATIVIFIVVEWVCSLLLKSKQSLQCSVDFYLHQKYTFICLQRFT